MNLKYAKLLTDLRILWDKNRDPEMSTKASFTSSASNPTTEKPHRPNQGNSDISKEMIDNVPVFDGKANELNQFLNTIESFSKLYNTREFKIVMLQTRGKRHEIIGCALEDNPDVDWATIKKKLTSNYGSTKSRIDASLQFKQLVMTDSETVGNYLARASTLFKTKLRYAAQWNTEYDKSNIYYVVHSLKPLNLRKKIFNSI